MSDILTALGITLIYASLVAFMISTILLGVYAYVKGTSVDLRYILDLTIVFLVGVLLCLGGMVI